MSEINPTAPRPCACRVVFGGDTAGLDLSSGFPSLRVALPVLLGADSEQLLPEPSIAGVRGEWSLFREGMWLAGFAVAAPEADLETASGDLYRGLFEAAAGLHLYRLWTYVPRINALTGGLENYRLFCRGRSLAFEERFGAAFQRVLPASSAVGSAAGPLAVGFLAGNAVPRHFENPRQVPAWKYPAQYGPRPPSFSRATSMASEDGVRIFVSGTAAIRGHASVADGLDGQLNCTLENLCLVGESAGAGPDLGGSSGWRRVFKVYLRHPADLPAAKARLDSCLVRPEDTVSYLRADICRADLLVEIEATLALTS